MHPQSLFLASFSAPRVFIRLCIFDDLALVSRLKELLAVGFPLPTVFKWIANLSEMTKSLKRLPFLKIFSFLFKRPKCEVFAA
jgi:hypothetical protein